MPVSRLPFRSSSVVAAAFFGLACGGGSTTEASTSISTISFASSSQAIYKGTTATLTVTAKGSDGNALPSSNADLAAIAWSVGDPTIATVVGTGTSATVTGIKFGSTTVRATSGSVQGTIAITVNNGITSITLAKGAASIAVGTQTTVTPTVVGPNPDHSVTLSTTNGTVGFVTAEGVVNARAAGTMNIVATSVADPTVSGSTQITVVAATLPSATITGMSQAASPAGCATAVGAVVVTTAVCGTVNLALNVIATDHTMKLIEVLVGSTVCASQTLDTKAAQTMTMSCNTAGQTPGPSLFSVRITHRTQVEPTVDVARTVITSTITIAP
jgi:hypothetical protein